MSGIKDQENIEELRKRLYDRQNKPPGVGRHDLSDNPIQVSRGWKKDDEKSVGQTPVSAGQAAVGAQSAIDPQIQTAPGAQTPNMSGQGNPPISNVPRDFSEPKKKHPYRAIILLFSLGFFVIAAIASSIYLFFGANEISTKNINVTMETPFAVAAGEVLPLQLSITNQNSVPIESVTLILKYPEGTKSTGLDPRDLYEERTPISDISPGEAVNIPVNMVLFGEENEEKVIEATVEYRVRGSNGTFFKDAEPSVVKINSSPLVLRVDSVDKISSGQDIEIRLIASSNSQTPLKNVVVEANYPSTFSFISSEPSPVRGQDQWLIEELAPEETYEIILTGLVSGVTGELSEVQFSAGNRGSGSQAGMGSVLSQTKHDYLIEQPFIAVDVMVNNQTGSDVVLGSGEGTNVTIIAMNTLDETLYDMRAEVIPKGNTIREKYFEVSNGFYDPNTKNINWEIAGRSDLEQVFPGSNRSFDFSLIPDKEQSAGTFDVSAKIFARRVNEARASEELVGTAIVRVKYSSVLSLESELKYNMGPFDDYGPIPPVVGENTSYTVTLKAEAGVNDLNNAEVQTSLPQHIKWLGVTDGDGVVEYNPVAKRLFWNIGNIEKEEVKEINMQVELLPSITQVNGVVTVLNRQEFNAVDSFTGETISTIGSRIINELPRSSGFKPGNGNIEED